MIKKSLAVLALASLVAAGACKKADETENLGTDTTAVPAAPAPMVDTMAAPATDTGAVTTDTTAVDTTATTPAP